MFHFIWNIVFPGNGSLKTFEKLDFSSVSSLESCAGARPTCTRVKKGLFVSPFSSCCLKPSKPSRLGLKRVPRAPNGWAMRMVSWLSKNSRFPRNSI